MMNELKVEDEDLEKLLYSFGKKEHKHLSELQLINWVRNHLNDGDYGKSKFNYFIEASNYAGKEPKIVLDIACGSGSFFFNCINSAQTVIGIDISHDLINIAKLKYKFYLKQGFIRNNNGLFIIGSGLNIPLKNGSVDSICSFQTIEHIVNFGRYLENCIRVLKKGGFMIMTAPDYFTFYEGHYQITWFPMLPKNIAKYYLYLRKKDPTRIETIYYVTNGKIKRKLKKIKGVVISDLRHRLFEDRFQRKLSVMKSRKSFFSLLIVKLLDNSLMKLILKNIYLLSQRKVNLLITKDI